MVSQQELNIIMYIMQICILHIHIYRCIYSYSEKYTSLPGIYYMHVHLLSCEQAIALYSFCADYDVSELL